MREYISVLTVLKVAASVIFILLHSPYNDFYNFGNNLEYLNNVEITSDIIFQRSLAKHATKRELNRSSVRSQLLENNSYNNVKCTSDDLSNYSQLKKKGLNDFDLYMKNYKHRYAKKKGVSKLDCYCENKVFDKIQRIYGIKEKMRNEKKGFKNYIFKKYGIVYILISLIPALSFIYVILFGVGDWGAGFLKHCTDPTHWTNIGNKKAHFRRSSVDNCEKIWLYKYRDLIIKSGDYLMIFSIIMSIIVVIVVIYVLIKFIKYEKLKAGKGKMSAMEYCRFAKDVFI